MQLQGFGNPVQPRTYLGHLYFRLTSGTTKIQLPHTDEQVWKGAPVKFRHLGAASCIPWWLGVFQIAKIAAAPLTLRGMACYEPECICRAKQ
jgi:hypothetical protein